MKRTSLLGFVGLLAATLAGCPIWGDGDGGSGPTPCYGNNCGCTQPADCQQNETCGSDGACHPGDCTFNGCPNGYVCQVDPSSDTASCVQGSGTGGGTGTGGSVTTTSSSSASSTTSTSSSTSSTSTSGTTSTSTTSSSGAPPPVYCGHPADCGAGDICGASGTCVPGPCNGSNACIYGYTCANDGTCQSMSANACDKDSDCAGLGSGYDCIAGPNNGGVCTAPSDQCFDQSQCDSGDNCVAGKCVIACTSDTQCRDGETCNTMTGVCSGVSQPCTKTSDCGSATLVCVGGACVPRSNGGTCPAGDVWDENGCIPNEAATFTCMNDGMQDLCAGGSICLHHDCYIDCDTPNQNACAGQTILDTCKPVADGSNTYHVCGTQQNLGSMCGAGSMGNQMCTGGTVCIDGFCK